MKNFRVKVHYGDEFMKELQSYGHFIRNLLHQNKIKSEELVSSLNSLGNVDTNKSAISRILTGKRMPTEPEALGISDVLGTPQVYEAYLLLNEYLLKKDIVSVLAFYEILDSVLDANEKNTTRTEASIDYPLLSKMIQNLYHHCLAVDVTNYLKTGFLSKLSEVSGFSVMIMRVRAMYQCFLYDQQLLSIKDRAWLATALLYFISTIDLIPDYLVPYGYIDDNVVVGFVFYKLFPLLKKYAEMDSLQTNFNETIHD